MPIWQTFGHGATLSTQGTEDGATLLLNDSGATNVFEAGTLYVVDAIVVCITTGDNLFSVSLIRHHEDISIAELQAQLTDELDVWYHYWAARGPLVYRTRTKLRLAPHEALSVNIKKEVGSDSELCRMGIRMLTVFSQK